MTTHKKNPKGVPGWQIPVLRNVEPIIAGEARSQWARSYLTFLEGVTRRLRRAIPPTDAQRAAARRKEVMLGRYYAVRELLRAHPDMTQRQMADLLGYSQRTVARYMEAVREKEDV